jgi:hypothetical protein
MASTAVGHLAGQWRLFDISILLSKTDGFHKGKGIIAAIVDIDLKTLV